MRKVTVLTIMLIISLVTAVPVSADDGSVSMISAAGTTHEVLFQNHCSYPVWVVIVGGTLYYPSPSQKYSVCQELPDHSCVPTTKCTGVAHGPNNAYKCLQGADLVDNGGFRLDADNTPGSTHTSTLTRTWQGSFWGRTGCVDDGKGSLTCDVGDCKVYQDGKGKLQCGGQGPYGPYKLTKGEFNLNEHNTNLDYYDVSLVDGFNIPMRIELKQGTFRKSNPDGKSAYDCGASEAATDLLPLFDKSGLSTTTIGLYLDKELVSIKSACEYAHESAPQFVDQYCCLGAYGPGKCDPGKWPADLRTAPFFKTYNPMAYSFAYNDASSTFTCNNLNENTLTGYIVTFCPANEPMRITLPEQDDHIHAPVMTPTPLATPAPTPAPEPAQTPVPRTPYHPATSGETVF